VTEKVRTGEPEAPEPAYRSTVTVGESPDELPAAPARGGVASRVAAPSAGLVRVTAGTTESTVNERVAGVESTLPAESVA
jgi:hypothetical protein